ncbi:MAG: ferredoxin family protein [Bacteroidales bacterium]|jgi:NAD-dependent dihydropyrimidine dehydrogenase PreA subunit|nr:ferredoxin family protein [Bacteroidales bacterium]
MSVVYIGLGIVILLWIAGYLYGKHKNRNKVVCVVEDNCSGCRRCVKICTHHVLEMVKDETGIHAAVKYPDRCNACGNCMKRCKFNALKLIERV